MAFCDAAGLCSTTDVSTAADRNADASTAADRNADASTVADTDDAIMTLDQVWQDNISRVHVTTISWPDRNRAGDGHHKEYHER